jgi:hypothetical protein
LAGFLPLSASACVEGVVNVAQAKFQMFGVFVWHNESSLEVFFKLTLALLLHGVPLVGMNSEQVSVPNVHLENFSLSEFSHNASIGPQPIDLAQVSLQNWQCSHVSVFINSFALRRGGLNADFVPSTLRPAGQIFLHFLGFIWRQFIQENSHSLEAN